MFCVSIGRREGVSMCVCACVCVFILDVLPHSKMGLPLEVGPGKGSEGLGSVPPWPTVVEIKVTAR
jgi:hypothetical protein